MQKDYSDPQLGTNSLTCDIVRSYLFRMRNEIGRGRQRRMQMTTIQKRAIDHYYQELAAYHEKKVTHETAVRSAFQNLLTTFAQSANWVLIPEQTLTNGKRPDGLMVLEERSVDLLSGRSNGEVTMLLADGQHRKSRHPVRLYILRELARMFTAAGLPIQACSGGLDGSPFTLDSPRLVVIAAKAADGPAPG